MMDGFARQSLIAVTCTLSLGACTSHLPPQESYAALRPPLEKQSGRTATAPDRWADLESVNNYVNSTVMEVSDMEQFGRDDVWRLPTNGKGDCEDFALMKRKLLIDRGYPASALSIGVGMSAQGEAHAVLLVATNQGEMVLDNLTSAIVPVGRSGMTIHSRQVGSGFLSVDGVRSTQPTADFPIRHVLASGGA